MINTRKKLRNKQFETVYIQLSEHLLFHSQTPELSGLVSDAT